MNIKPFDESRYLDFLPCPFCGNNPVVRFIGNDSTTRRAIEVKCGSCGATRIDAAIMHGFDWLEDIAVKNWNKRA